MTSYDLNYRPSLWKSIGGLKKAQEVNRRIARNVDVVVPVPDSGVPAAIGYAQASGVPFELGIIRNHYVGRTFIEPADHIRHLGVKLKHNANRAQLEGKRVILVDDSIVRGTTSKKIIKMVRDAGAAEVHMRIASPPTTDSCFYGVDTPEKKNLLAANYTVEEMRRLIGADSLNFVSINGLYRAMRQRKRESATTRYCDACFTGNYPVEIPKSKGPSQLHLFDAADHANGAAMRRPGSPDCGRSAGRTAPRSNR